MTPEQRASQTLFGDQKYVPATDGPFRLGDCGETIQYSALVARYRAQDDGEPMDFAAARIAASRIYDCMDHNLTMFDACCDETPQAARDLHDAAKTLHELLQAEAAQNVSRRRRQIAAGLLRVENGLACSSAPHCGGTVTCPACVS